MKQRITPKQLTQLTHEQKLTLHSLWNPTSGDKYVWYESNGAVGKDTYMITSDVEYVIDDLEASPRLYALPLLSIGQMIEFLNKSYLVKVFLKEDKSEVHITRNNSKYTATTEACIQQELCDALWEAVTQISKG